MSRQRERDRLDEGLLFQRNPHPMWVFDIETLRFLEVNDAAVDTYGYSRDEFLRMTLDDVRLPEDIGGLREHLGHPLTRDLTHAGEWRHVRRNGEPIDVEIRWNVLEWNGRPAGLAAVSDISERKRAEKELTEFFSLSVDLMGTCDPGGIVLRLNARWVDVMGYAIEEMLGRSYLDFLHPEEWQAGQAAMAAIVTGQELRDFTHRFRHRDGTFRTLELRARLTDGVIFFTARDVTEQRKAEGQLRRLARAVEQSPASVVITDREGRIEYVNPKFEEVTGYRLKEIAGQTPRVLKSGRMLQEEYRKLWQTILAGAIWRGEFENRKKDGSTYWEQASIAPVRDEKGEVSHFVAVKEDITERRALQAQLLHAQKMEAVGLLAGGIAHDFNNLLTVVNGYSDLLISSWTSEPSVSEHLSAIRDAGERAAELTKKLLIFSRRQASEPRLVDVNGVVSELNQFLARVLPEGIELEITLSAVPATVVADPVHLQQVVINLVVNARDAMPQGGRLAIEISKADSVSTCSGTYPKAASGKYVLMTVADSGVGMDDSVKRHLFEPFFTTKPQGQGTGLGLAIVYGIVKESGGIVCAQSEPGTGAKFEVYLPWVPQEQQPQPERVSAAPSVTGPHGDAILIVEDFAEIRELAAGALTAKGYKVFEAGGYEHAVGILERGEIIDLLITDVILPGRSGVEVAEMVRERLRGLPVLFVSGHSRDALAAQQLALTDKIFLKKPFTASSLLGRVRELLAERNAQYRILVADDDPAIRDLMRDILNRAGYQVSTASNGLRAMAAIKSEHFDMMITDLVMPEQEGLETISELRKRNEPMPIVAMSGAFGGTFLAVAAALGACATLLKPFTEGQLLKTVRAALRSMKAHASNPSQISQGHPSGLLQ